MKLGHFETLRPLCPVCRAAGRAERLVLAGVIREERGDVIEGMLHCSHAACLREYPILDGVPLLVADLRGFVGGQLHAILARDDLAPATMSLIGDCCGPGTLLEHARQQLSSYAWDHYGEFDPHEPKDEPLAPRPGSVARVLDALWKLAPLEAEGPLLDAGCSVGRSTHLLAERSGRLTLGVDMNYPMLRLAAETLRGGRVRYPRRRVGLVYDVRDFPVTLARPELVDFWACDGLALPIADATFAAACALNLLDCVAAPRELLESLARVLRPDGLALLACPYDWSSAATPVEAWLGGHSQRGPGAGASDTLVRSLLEPDGHPQSIGSLVREAEHAGVPWHVRLHERSTLQYRVHLLAARKQR